MSNSGPNPVNKKSFSKKGCLIALAVVVGLFFIIPFFIIVIGMFTQTELKPKEKVDLLYGKMADSLSNIKISGNSKIDLEKKYDLYINKLNDYINNQEFKDFKSALNKTKDSLVIKKDSILLVKEDFDKENLKLAEELRKNARKDLETTLRNEYLDKGLDIKVRVYGKDNSTLELKFILFNDVWFRRFEKQGSFNDFNKAGFKKIILTDGYDYSKYMEYNN